MRKDEDFKTETLAFTEKVKNIRHYDKERWFSNAYSTLNAKIRIQSNKTEQAWFLWFIKFTQKPKILKS